jgi:hypothetical protein
MILASTVSLGLQYGINNSLKLMTGNQISVETLLQAEEEGAIILSRFTLGLILFIFFTRKNRHSIVKTIKVST